MDNKNTMIVVAVRFSLVAFLSEYKLRKKFNKRSKG